MQRASVFLMSTGLVLGAAGVALADGADASGEPAGDPSAAPVAAPPMTPPGEANAAWSQSYIDRPLTLPAKMLSIYGDFDIANVSFTDPVSGASSSATVEGLQLGVAYGVSDKLTVGADYAVTLHPDGSAKGPLDLYASFGAYHKDKLSAAVGGGLIIDFTDPTSEQIFLGAAIRYQVAPKIAIFTGSPTTAPGPAGQHLQIGLNSKAPITFSIPVGVGLQATPQAYVYVDTTIADISISNSSNAFLFSDFIPVDIGGLFAVSPKLDVGAHLSFLDLKGSASDLVFGVSARYFMGK